MKKSSPSRKDSSRKKESMSIPASALKSQIAVSVSGLIFLLCFCAVAASSADPDRIIKPLSLCSLFLSAFIGGITAVRLSGDGILSGLISGLFTALLIFCLSVLPLPHAEVTPTETIINYICIVGSAAVGSVVGKSRKKNPHRNPYQKR